MASPLVSVIIPSYNSAHYVIRAVESALAQTYSSVEIIVIDDGSVDSTAELLKQYNSKIRYIYQPNSGLGAARNRGIREAQGDFIAFLDADDLWFRDKLERQIAVLLSNPRVGLVHSNFIYLDDKTNKFYTKWRPRHALVGRCYVEVFFRNSIFVSTVVVRKECLDNVGLFEEKSFPGTEDFDLWLRIAQCYEFAHVPLHLAVYRQHSTNMSHNNLRMITARLAVIRHALTANPSLWQTIGKRQVKQRLFGLYFIVGYLHFDEGNFANARRFLSQALRLQPLSAYTWTLCLSTLLPAPWVGSLRTLKQRFGTFSKW